MMRSRLALGFAAALLGGCGPERVEAPPRPAPSRAELPAEAKAPGDDPAVDEVIARALEQVSRLRGLDALEPVNGRVVGREQMLAHVREQIRTQVPAQVIRAQTEMLFALGVVPVDFDYEHSILELMGAELAGFYDPEHKTMYLAADLGSAERQATLAHELVHALQDQHYDLGERISYREDASDQQSAIHALAEGDATSAMMDQVLAARGITALDLADDLLSLEARGSIEMSPQTAGVPSIIKRSLVSPYVDGLGFVHWLRRRGGWAAVDSAWRQPPVTTEQVLHPEKFLSREAAEPIELPVASPTGPQTVSYRDVLGEQSVRLLFEEWMPRRTAVEAASAWGGDRIAVFAEGERFAVAWHLRYDDEAAARRGLVALARGVLRAEREAAAADPDMPVAAKQAEVASASGKICRERPQRGPFAVARDGRDLGIVLGPFVRNSEGAASDGACMPALRWAQAVALQGR
jgi:hypothetical protein